MVYDTSTKGMPYRVALAPHVPAGALAILLHARPWTRKQPKIECMDHAVSIFLPAADKVPVVVTNVHFPPRMRALQRRLSILQATAFHAGPRGHEAGVGGRVCGAVPKGRKVTRRMAEYGRVRLQPGWRGLVVSFPVAACGLCISDVERLPPPLADVAQYRPMQWARSGESMCHFHDEPSGLTSLLAFTINPGGLVADTAPAPRSPRRLRPRRGVYSGGWTPILRHHPLGYLVPGKVGTSCTCWHAGNGCTCTPLEPQGATDRAYGPCRQHCLACV